MDDTAIVREVHEEPENCLEQWKRDRENPHTWHVPDASIQAMERKIKKGSKRGSGFYLDADDQYAESRARGNRRGASAKKAAKASKRQWNEGIG